MKRIKIKEFNQYDFYQKDNGQPWDTEGFEKWQRLNPKVKIIDVKIQQIMMPENRYIVIYEDTQSSE